MNMTTEHTTTETPTKRLEQSLKQMKQLRDGQLSKKSWWDYIQEQKEKEN